MTVGIAFRATAWYSLNVGLVDKRRVSLTLDHERARGSADPVDASLAEARSAAASNEDETPQSPKHAEKLGSVESPGIASVDDGDGGARQLSPADIRSIALSVLEDDKAEDIVTIELEGKSTLADAMIVASGRSHRHVGAIADHIQRRLKAAGVKGVSVEGLPHCDWVLVDAGDIIVHVFRPEVRSFYNLERIWSPEALIDPADQRSAASR